MEEEEEENEDMKEEEEDREMEVEEADDEEKEEEQEVVVVVVVVVVVGKMNKNLFTICYIFQRLECPLNTLLPACVAEHNRLATSLCCDE